MLGWIILAVLLLCCLPLYIFRDTDQKGITMITIINRGLEKLPWNQYGQRWSIWRYFDIMDRNDPTQVYLRRLRVIQTPWFGFYIHWINLPDNDRHLHDHPWNFWSFVAKGGYAEEVQDHLNIDRQYPKFHPRWTIHRMRIGMGHKIVHVLPGTITVLLIGRRQRDWGFWTEDGWVPWREYNSSTNGPDPFMS